MDLNNLKQTVSNLTLYDIKAGVRKMQNGRSAQNGPWFSFFADSEIAVMNYTEMEAKVRLRSTRRATRVWRRV